MYDWPNQIMQTFSEIPLTNKLKNNKKYSILADHLGDRAYKKGLVDLFSE